jgi:hypothetical protein
MRKILYITNEEPYAGELFPYYINFSYPFEDDGGETITKDILKLIKQIITNKSIALLNSHHEKEFIRKICCDILKGHQIILNDLTKNKI